jgi:hypothetical protein
MKWLRDSLNGKFRAECLNAHWFLSLDEARLKCEAWRRDMTRCARTVRSATKCLRCFIGPLAIPASLPPDEAAVVQPPVVQAWGKFTSGSDSTSSWPSFRGQVSGNNVRMTATAVSSTPPIGSRQGWLETGRTKRSTSRKPIPRLR